MLRRMRRRKYSLERFSVRLPGLRFIWAWPVWLGCVGLLFACVHEEPDASFAVQQSVGQLAVTHAPPGSPLEVRNSEGEPVAFGTADEQGSKLFRKLTPGSGYRIVRTDAVPEDKTRSLTVYSIENSKKDPSFYREQTLKEGFGYLTTRDGTKLSVYVTFPGPVEKGPFPTVVNMSGYSPSRPGKKDDRYEGLCKTWPVLCDQPYDPSALISGLNGYATVSVNLRGTGCSGGAYDFFDTMQKLDAYDVIETVAAQSFVLHHKVGMTGLSYPGISQLFAAAQKPPSLAAITPLSVVGNMYLTMAPGGILNNGFALNWITRVLDKAGPYKQGWEQDMVSAGDTVCKENQLLHSQKANLIEVINAHSFYPPEIADPINPDLFVEDIDVPVFLAGAWQDEQTGAYFLSLLDKFRNPKTTRYFLYNGVHPDGFAPQVSHEWKTFLDIYVAQKVPQIDPALRPLLPMLFKEFFGATLEIPPDRLAGQTNWEAAKKSYEAEPQVTILLESGGDATTLGGPQARHRLQFAKWPIPNKPLRYYLRHNGELLQTPSPDTNRAVEFEADPQAGTRGNLATNGDIWARIPKWDWKPLEQGKALAWQTYPLGSDLLLIGTASVDLYVQSTAEDADLQAVLSELRSDGQETFVQAGVLRARSRALTPQSQPLWPEHSYLEKDGALLPKNTWSLVRIGIPGFAHVFRKGSLLRLSINTPGGNHAEWRFQNQTLAPGTKHRVALTAKEGSSLLLPEIAVSLPQNGYPPCPSLRGQPCRKIETLVNTPVP